jgi:hypothetical protein
MESTAIRLGVGVIEQGDKICASKLQILHTTRKLIFLDYYPLHSSDAGIKKIYNNTLLGTKEV